MMTLSDLDVIKILIEQGMRLEQRNQMRKTILHHWTGLRFRNTISGESEALKVIRLLLENGVDLNARDNEGYTPLLIAACDFEHYPPNFTVLDLLLEIEDIDRK